MFCCSFVVHFHHFQLFAISCYCRRRFGSCDTIRSACSATASSNRKPHAWLSRKPKCLAILRCRWAKLIRHDKWKANPSTRCKSLKAFCGLYQICRTLHEQFGWSTQLLCSVHSSLGETRNHSQSIIKTVSSAMHRDIYWNWMVWFNDAITYQACVYNRVYFTDWNSLLAVRCVHAGRQWQCRVLGRLARQCRRACLTQSPIPLWHQVGHGGTPWDVSCRSLETRGHIQNQTEMLLAATGLWEVDVCLCLRTALSLKLEHRFTGTLVLACLPCAFIGSSNGCIS